MLLPDTGSASTSSLMLATPYAYEIGLALGKLEIYEFAPLFGLTKVSVG
jgi:hypothetical protein